MDKCEFDTCGLQAITRGYCSGHYQQLRKGGPLTPLQGNRRSEERVCPVRDCARVVASRGLCQRHMSVANRHKIHPEDIPGLYLSGCNNPSCASDVKLSIDHDHNCCPGANSCGRCIRGVLCQDCNHLLGWMERISRNEDQVRGLNRYLTSTRPTLQGFRYVYRKNRGQEIL